VTLRLFGSCLSIPPFLCISFRPDLKKYINIAMHYFREEVIIDFRLARLASYCKLSPRALKKALFSSRKAKHTSLLWGMLVICRFPGLMMPFHHQTAKNVSSKKKKTSKASNTFAWLARFFEMSVLSSSLGHLVEQIRFQAYAVISESQQDFT